VDIICVHLKVSSYVPRLLPSLVEIVDLIQQSLKCKSLMGDLDYAMI
jgi:hypothetical protein